MPIYEDYLMRMAGQFARALKRVISHKEEARFEDAQRELDGAYDELLGLSSAVVAGLSANDLLDSIELQVGDADRERLAVSLILLLVVEGDILAAQGQGSEAGRRYRTARELMGLLDLSDEAKARLRPLTEATGSGLKGPGM